MFDYILTGPISGVSAGLYLVGLLNELLRYAHFSLVLPMNVTAAVFAVARHRLFLVGEHQGHSRVERKSAADHVRDHGHGGPVDRLVRLHALDARRAPSALAASLESDVFATTRSGG